MARLGQAVVQPNVLALVLHLAVHLLPAPLALDVVALRLQQQGEQVGAG